MALEDAPDVRVTLPEGRKASVRTGQTFGRELLWRIGADKIGTHVVTVRLMRGSSRTSPKTPSERVTVTVVVSGP